MFGSLAPHYKASAGIQAIHLNIYPELDKYISTDINPAIVSQTYSPILNRKALESFFVLYPCLCNEFLLNIPLSYYAYQAHSSFLKLLKIWGVSKPDSFV